MNRILLLAAGLMLFGCDNTSKNSENAGTGVENTTSEDNGTGSVQKGAGTEIFPQLEGVADSANRLKVDTISSSTEAQKAK